MQTDDGSKRFMQDMVYLQRASDMHKVGLSWLPVSWIHTATLLDFYDINTNNLQKDNSTDKVVDETL